MSTEQPAGSGTGNNGNKPKENNNGNPADPLGIGNLTAQFGDISGIIGQIKNMILGALRDLLKGFGINLPGLENAGDNTNTDVAAGKTFVVIGDSIGKGLGDNLAKIDKATVVNGAADGASLFAENNINATLEKVQRGHIAVIAMGTDDIPGLTADKVQEYARRVVGIAGTVKEKGGIPVLLEAIERTGPDSPEKTTYNNTVRALNAAMKTYAQEQGFEVTAVNGKAEVSSTDNMHLTDKGDQAVVTMIEEQTKPAPAQQPAGAKP